MAATNEDYMILGDKEKFIEPILEAAKTRDLMKIREIVRSNNINLNLLHSRVRIVSGRSTNSKLEHSLVMMVVNDEISLDDFIQTIDVFFELGLSAQFLESMYQYFILAIRHNNHQMIRYISWRTGQRYIRQYIQNEIKTYISILWYVYTEGDLQTIQIFINAGITPNDTVQYRLARIYPVCIFVKYKRADLLRYFISIGANLTMPLCDAQELQTPTEFQYKSLLKITEESDDQEIKDIIDFHVFTQYRQKLTLQQIVFLNVIINDMDLDNVARYIQSENYQWLMTTENPMPIVSQAKKKVVMMIQESKKRQREIG